VPQTHHVRQLSDTLKIIYGYWDEGREWEKNQGKATLMIQVENQK
jgi:hypothetical protein